MRVLVRPAQLTDAAILAAMANDLNDHVGWPPRRCGREQCHWSGESTLATAARSSFYGRLGAGGAEVRIIGLDGERLRALAGRRPS